MAWVYLLIAGLMEIGWPLGIKYAWDDETKSVQIIPGVLAVLSMAASGLFLYLATMENRIPMGTAYAVWTGIGSVGAFIAGIVLFREPATAARMTCVGLIVLGIVGLKLFGEGH
jgi:quaternary ammonium compound-resistance protein SugE